ncbi:MAG: hypothetical protein ACPG19_07300 [Saprospiraceae bacterium]
MSNALIGNVIRFVMIYLFQVLILFNVEMYEYVNLLFYPIFILLLPIRTPHSLLIFIAFVVGVSIGMYNNAVGEHAAASVLIAFLRPTVLSILEPRGGYDANQSPTKHYLGFSWFAQYAGILIFIHFVALFSLEVMGFGSIVIFKIILSYIISMMIIFLYTLIFNPKS